MADPTTKVNAQLTNYEDSGKDKWQVSAGDITTGGNTALYQNDEMMGLVLSGSNAGMISHFDDTQAMLFAGLWPKIQTQYGSPDAPPLTIADILRPRYFSMPSSSATPNRTTDLGKAVYAVDSGHVQIGSTGLNFANFVGWIHDVITTSKNTMAGTVAGGWEIVPAWAMGGGDTSTPSGVNGSWTGGPGAPATTGTGGNGSSWTTTGGAGGTATSGTGGNGGAITEVTGAGGAATSGTGGNGGAYNSTTGVGGAATTGTAGNSGAWTGGSGAAGAATGAAGIGGISGNVNLKTGAGGAASSGTGGAAGASGTITMTTGAGGNASGTGASVGGASGAMTIGTGAGGTAAGTSGAGASGALTISTGNGGANSNAATGAGAVGGAGGALGITGGNGGNTANTGTAAGGAGATITITAGTGGNATAGTGNGGAGGSIVLLPGIGGTSSGGSAGANGTVTATGLIAKSTSAAAIAAARTLAAADSGGTFSVAKTSAYAITLPTPAQGIRFRFMVLDTGANAVTISDGSAHLFGVVNVAGTNIIFTGTTITLVATGGVGDWVDIVGIDATHYHVIGACVTAAKITVA